MLDSFPRFLELPDDIQTTIWHHALPSSLARDFRWTPWPSYPPLEDYPNHGMIIDSFERDTVTVGTRSGRYLYAIAFTTENFHLGPLKEWFNIVSVSCGARMVGLGWWRDAVEGMDLKEGWWEDERNPLWWRGEDGVFDAAALRPPNEARLAESRGLVLEVLGECIQDVQWMVDNPEDPVVRRKRLYPPRDDSPLATQTFHGFENLPRELQVMVWEEYMAMWEGSTPYHYSLDIFSDWQHERREGDKEMNIYMHKFVAPKSKVLVYYTRKLPAAAAVCRFSRLRAMKAWRREVKGTEIEKDSQYRVFIRARVLHVLEELAEEVEKRLISCATPN